jgi:lipopolysaccharide export system permease protein
MAVATAAGGMNRLDRYIAATVLVGALMGLVVIVSLSFVFEFIDEADDIGRGDYDLAAAMAVVALSMVQRAYEAFPMATLIGALVSLGALAARSELIVMRAVGRSVGQIARAVVVAGIGLAVLAGLLGDGGRGRSHRHRRRRSVGTGWRLSPARRPRGPCRPARRGARL